MLRQFAIFMLLALALASAQLYMPSYSITMEAQNDDRVVETVRMELENRGSEPVGEIEFSLDPKAQKLMIENATYSGSALVFDEPIPPGGVKSISIYFHTHGFIGDADGAKLFLSTVSMPFDVGEFMLVLVLPTGYTLSTEAGQPAAFPEALYSSDGQRIIAAWSHTSLEKGHTVQASARYSQPFGPLVEFVQTDIPLVDKTMIVPGIILAFLFGYFLAAGLIGAFFQRFTRAVRGGYSGDEEKVARILEKGSLTQDVLQRQTGFSKAKLSRVLRGMEERSMVTKSAKGRTNLVKLN